MLGLRTSIYLTNDQLKEDKRENRFWIESHDFLRVNLNAKRQQLFLYLNNKKLLIGRLNTATKKKKSRPFLGFKRVARKLCL